MLIAFIKTKNFKKSEKKSKSAFELWNFVVLRNHIDAIIINDFARYLITLGFSAKIISTFINLV